MNRGSLASHLPRVTYFFGVPGVGKSYCARILSEASGVYWFEADSDLPDEIREAVKAKIPFSEPQRDRLYTHVGKRIHELLKLHERIIVSQATFKERHRTALCRDIPGLVFVWVDAPEKTVGERLISRGGVLDPKYGRQIAKMFEPPGPQTLRVLNDCDDVELAQRLTSLFLPS